MANALGFGGDPDEEMLQLLQTNERLKKKLEQREMMLFEMKKSRLKQPKPFRSIRGDAIHREAASLGNIKHKNRTLRIADVLGVYLRYVGIVVKEYSPESCVVMFDIGFEGASVAQYAVRTRKRPDSDLWELYTYNLPLGFCLDEIARTYEIMTKDYFRMMHRALTAHHSRIEQIDRLKRLLPSNVQILYSTDGSLVELVMLIAAKSPASVEDDVMRVSLRLQYGSCKSRPDDLTITRLGASSSEDMKKLKIQSEPFLVGDLASAFTTAFLNENNEFYISDCNAQFHIENGADHNQSETQSHHRRLMFQPAAAASEVSPRTAVSNYRALFPDSGRCRYDPNEDEDVIKKHKKPSKPKRADKSDERVDSPKGKKSVKKSTQVNRRNRSKNDSSLDPDASVNKSNKKAIKKTSKVKK